jgi:Domain of unknown function (DUF4145)
VQLLTGTPPELVTHDHVEKARARKPKRDDEAEAKYATLIKYLERAADGSLFLRPRQYLRPDYEVANLFASYCVSCNDVALWMHSTMLYPRARYDTEPADDLPEDIKRDFNEAREILDRSPRGAAALLRLCIQKLCKHLGLPGKRIDDDIATLVKGGLDSRVQKALDIVRVIGNEAVHPGTMDLRDDQKTAAKCLISSTPSPMN